MEHIKTQQFFIEQKTRFGSFALLWSIHNDKPKILKIVLPNPALKCELSNLMIFKDASDYSIPAMREIGEKIAAFMEGEKISFSLELIQLELCSDFQQHVLRAEHQIPYGKVSTYKRIADYLGHPAASRAVGNALAKNPFPIIIPCHRAIRSDLSPGGFQGGERMKRKLLEFEGNQFDENIKIKNPLFYF